MMTFYDRFGLLCKSSGKSIEQIMNKALGREKGGHDIYQGWRRRGVCPRGDVLYEISKILKVPMETFFEDSPQVSGISARVKALGNIEELSDEQFAAVQIIVKNLLSEKNK